MPKNLTELNTSFAEGGASISADGLTIYFDSNRPFPGKGNGDIWYATRQDVHLPFGTPQNLTAINSSAEDTNPSISADNLTIYFTRSNVPGNPVAVEIMVATRPDAASPFGIPQVVTEVNIPDGDDYAPSISSDGLALYFTSFKPIVSDDIYVATRMNPIDPFGTPVPVPGVNTIYSDAHPSISADGLRLYFQSDRDHPNTNDFDIFVAERPDLASPFNAPIRLSDIVNTPGGESQPSISFDDAFLYFTANRIGGQGSNDLWVTTCPGEVSGRFSEIPLRVRRDRDSLVLRYENLGNCTDQYNVYEGTIERFYSHVPSPCNVPFVLVGPKTLESVILPDFGSTYYLITATWGGEEGPSGFSSDGEEREPAFNVCR